MLLELAHELWADILAATLTCGQEAQHACQNAQPTNEAAYERPSNTNSERLEVFFQTHSCCLPIGRSWAFRMTATPLPPKGKWPRMGRLRGSL